LSVASKIIPANQPVAVPERIGLHEMPDVNDPVDEEVTESPVPEFTVEDELIAIPLATDAEETTSLPPVSVSVSAACVSRMSPAFQLMTEPDARNRSDHIRAVVPSADPSLAVGLNAVEDVTFESAQVGVSFAVSVRNVE